MNSGVGESEDMVSNPNLHNLLDDEVRKEKLPVQVLEHLCSPPTLFVVARGRHRSAHAAKLVDVAATQALRRHRRFPGRNCSLRMVVDDAPSSSPVHKPSSSSQLKSSLSSLTFAYC
nr:hypothetical protein Itr_chr06CG12500 [Ipomoea trifida]